MAKLVYDETGRVIFTKEMKSEYKILAPMMLPIHFAFLERILRDQGYDIEFLDTTGPEIVNEGLQNVHNDTCYPALLVIGQLISAIKSGKYDPDRIALMITQTGGGCRASNYIHLLRKALKKHGLSQIPVISFAVVAMEDNPGFRLSVPTMLKMAYAVAYGDRMMCVANQIRPYESTKGDTDRLIEEWVKTLTGNLTMMMNTGRTFNNIVKSFSEIPVERTKKIKVGVVGEIYVKYAALGNNNLEQFLQDEGCEVVVPGLMGFIFYMFENNLEDYKRYGGSIKKKIFSAFIKRKLEKIEAQMTAAIKQDPSLMVSSNLEHLKSLVKGYVSLGNKMGEGWLLVAEMLELVTGEVKNVICTQPFGCLPNHIVGKGMIRKIRENNPGANIVAIDYDPGATKINQENRIKLMLATARQNLNKEKDAAYGAKVLSEALDQSLSEIRL